MAQRNIESEKTAAQKLLQRPEYAGVLDLKHGDPVKTKFFSDLTQMAYGRADPIFTAAAGQYQPSVSALGGGSTEQLQQFYGSALTGATIPPGPPAGATVLPGGARTPPVSTEGDRYRTARTEAQERYLGHLTKAPTVEMEFQKGLKEKGYDLETGIQGIDAKRSELMKAMTEGTFETRDYEKVGRIAAEMNDLIADQSKKTREVESMTKEALGFFKETGLMKEKELAVAESNLEEYISGQKTQWQKAKDIATLTGYFMGKPTLAREKAFKPTGDGTPVVAEIKNWEKDLIGDYDRYVRDDTGKTKNPFSNMTSKESTRLKQLHAQYRSEYGQDLQNAKAYLTENAKAKDYKKLLDGALKQIDDKYGSAFGGDVTKQIDPNRKSKYGIFGDVFWGKG